MFLTGAAGFVGSFTARELLRRNCEVSVLIRPGGNTWRVADIENRLNIVEGDLEALATIESHFKRVPPDAIVHLAWGGVAHETRNEPSQLNNIPAVTRLLETGLRYGCENWIGLGSQAEYGNHSGVISEAAVPAPNSLYGAAKLALCYLTESLCGAGGARSCWIRLFSCYGPQNDPAWMLPYMTRKLLRGERPSLTPGEQLWDYVYVEDVAKAVADLTLHPSAKGIFNVGSGAALPLRRIIEQVRDLIDPMLPLGFGDVPYRPDQVMHLEADISRICDATGWTPRVPLEEGLRRCVDWERSQLRQQAAS